MKISDSSNSLSKMTLLTNVLSNIFPLVMHNDSSLKSFSGVDENWFWFVFPFFISKYFEIISDIPIFEQPWYHFFLTQKGTKDCLFILSVYHRLSWNFPRFIHFPIQFWEICNLEPNKNRKDEEQDRSMKEYNKWIVWSIVWLFVQALWRNILLLNEHAVIDKTFFCKPSKFLSFFFQK